MSKQKPMRTYELMLLIATNIICLFVVGDSIENAKRLALVVLILVALTIMRVKQNKYLFIMFCIMFYVLLSAIVLAVFNYSKQSGALYYSDINTIHVKCYIVFSSVLFYFSPHFVKSPTNSVEHRRVCYGETDLSELEVYNPIVFIINIFILGFIYVYSFSFSLTGGYSSSALYEYSILFFTVAWLYGKDNQVCRIVLFVFGAYYILIGLISGDRSSLFMLALLMVLVYQKRIKMSYVFWGSLGAVILSNMIDTFRHIGIKSVTFLEMWNNAFSNGFYGLMSSTARSSYAAGNTIIYLALNYEGSTLSILLTRILNVFLPNSLVKSISLTYMAKKYYVNYGGGMFASYFYFYGGYFGVLLASLLLCYILKCVYNGRESRFCTLLRVVLPAMTLRWFLYSPMALFSACLFNFWLIFTFFDFVDKLTKRGA